MRGTGLRGVDGARIGGRVRWRLALDLGFIRYAVIGDLGEAAVLALFATVSVSIALVQRGRSEKRFVGARAPCLHSRASRSSRRCWISRHWPVSRRHSMR